MNPFDNQVSLWTTRTGIFNVAGRWWMKVLVLALVLWVMPLSVSAQLTLEFRAPHNFVVDSNVKTPATYAPQAAYIGAEICNDGDEPLDDVVAYIGDYTAGTPGVYPITTIPVGQRIYSGSYAFRHVGGRLGTAEAIREIGTLAPGECELQLWLVTYPRMDCEQINDDWSQCSGGVPVFGANTDLTDDLQLDFDIWVNGRESGSPVETVDTRTITMRRMISASANKIWPNTTSKVPKEYLDIVNPYVSPSGWSILESGDIQELYPGEVFTAQGIWYDFGRVIGGFDNDGDLVPDYNAWMQPVGDAAFFDTGCFRVVGMQGILIVKLNDGTEQIIPFEDNTYFQNLPPNNTGVVGLVFYRYMALDAPCVSYISPYQLVASGNNNEKFTGDYGVLAGGATPPLVTPPSAAITKSGSPNPVAPEGLGVPPSDGIVTWTIDFQNTSLNPIGNPEFNFPVVIRDAIPLGVTYVAGSADIVVDGGVEIRYSVDGGVTYTTSEPVPASAVTHIEWRLNERLPVDGTGTASFQVVVPFGYPSITVPNTATLSIGQGDPIAEDTAAVLVTGNRVLGDTVFDDNGAGPGGVLGDGIQNGSEPGIEGVLVKLYWDVNEDGILDPGDILLNADITDASGNYLFEHLPAGKFIVAIDPASFPDGYGPTTPMELASDLSLADDYDVDFGLLPALSLDKKVIGSSNVLEGQEVKFQIDVVNRLRPSTGSQIFEGPTCEYIGWAQTSVNVSKPFSNYLNAQFAPDGNVATGNFGNQRDLEVHTFDFGTPPVDEAILGVEVLYSARRAGTITDDSLAFRFRDGTLVRKVDNFIPTRFNTISTSLTDYTWDLTNAVSWDWAKFASGDYKININTSKFRNADGATFSVDAVGFRVLTDCGEPIEGVYDPLSSVFPATVTDTYDPDQLEYVSATVTPASVDEVNGEIVWENLGPINPGGFIRIVVTFRGKPFPTKTDQTIVNNAAVTEAWFVDGRPANEPWDDETINGRPAGSISGFIWSDTNGNGWQPTASPFGPGYESGEPFLAGVRVDLIQCLEYDNQGGCASADEVVVGTTLTNAGGYYEFTGLESGSRYSVRVVPTDYVVALTQTGDPDDDPNPTRRLNANANGGTCGGGGQSIPCNNRWDLGLLELVIGTSSYGTYSPYTASVYDYTHVNFGYTAATTPAIFGYLWRDINQNGIFDANEQPLAGLSVCLDTNNNGVCDGGEPTSVTDANGRYQFTGLPAGQSYSIVVDAATLPPGSYQTGDPDYPNVPCVVCDNRYVTATLVAGTVNGPYDFGYFVGGASTIGDTVFMDSNGNGIQDGDEGGVSGVRLRLYQDFNGNNAFDPGFDVLIDEQITDAQGTYLFFGLAAGVYFVVLDASTLPSGYKQTADPAEPGVCVVCNGRSGPISLNGSNHNLDIDFGYQPPAVGSIGDTVWRDLNGDGVQGGASEMGISNVTVWLCPASAPVCDGGSAIATQVTDANGKYLFENLPDGSYKVAVDTNDPDLPRDSFNLPYTPSTPTSYTVSISGGNSVLTADFGFVWLGAIGDFIFYDANQNGQQDFNETGIGGVTVYLYKESVPDSGMFDELVATTVTADGMGAEPLGQYFFTGLMPMPYMVRVETDIGPLVGMTLSADPDTDGIPCGVLTPDTEPPVSVCDDAFIYTRLGFGAVFTGADFGYIPTGVIGDSVWLDLDQNGIQGPYEPGLANVRVFIDSNNNGVLDWTDLNGDGEWNPGEGERWIYTDLNGEYLFYDLPDGVYTIRVDASTLPLPLDPSYDVNGGIVSPTGVATVEIAGGMVTSTGNSWCSSPDCSLDVDFGYKFDGDFTISGTVCLDDDPAFDGVCSGATGEVGLEGHLVFLVLNGELLGAVETQAGGGYTIQGLPAGVYQVVLSTTKAPLDIATLTTELGDTPATAIVDFGTSVAQTVEVIDAIVSGVDFAFKLDVELDFGDLPDVYRTTFSKDGARHIIPENGATIYLGVVPPDAEPDGQPSPFADGDDLVGVDDEDGVELVAPWLWTEGADGGTARVTVGGNRSGWLVGFMDFNQDGTFLNPGEMIINEAVSPGTETYTFDIPAGTFGGGPRDVYARFRVFTSQPAFSPLAYVGQTTNGEVEDYLFQTGPAGGVVGSRVWLDENGNGIQDAGETGIPNLTVTLSGNDAEGTPVSLTTLTDLNGNYLFTGVPPSDGTGHKITVTPLAGMAPTWNEDTGIVNPDNVSVVVLGQDIIHRTADFGYNWAPSEDVLNGTNNGAIGDRIWIDANGDGVQNPGEPGLGGVTVQLYYDSTGDGAIDALYGTTTTFADGNYVFDNLPAGIYRVVVDAPTGYVQTGDPDGSLDNRTTAPIILAPGDVYVNADFGYQPEGAGSTIGGKVYLDANGNAVFEGADYGVAGVSVALLDDAGDVIATTVTDVNGNYAFFGIPAGDYTVWINDAYYLLSGLAPTEDPDGGADRRALITVDGSATYPNVYFGFTPAGQTPSLGVIGDTIFLDRNGNGFFDAGEGLQGVLVRLYSTADMRLIDATRTNANGAYLFGGLPAGTYMVEVVVNTLPNSGAGLTNTVDPDTAAPGNHQSTVTLSDGGIRIDQDFGYAADTPNTLSGILWNDANADGTLDAVEDGRFEGIVVVLRTSAGDMVAVTVTDANGNYLFEGLPDGAYWVDIMAPAGLLNGYWHSLGTLDAAGQSQPDPYPVLLSGGNAYTADFGYYSEPAGLGDFVWNDLNEDGIQDMGEPGIAGVLVQLDIIYPNNDATRVLTVTDINGFYTFNNLLLYEYHNGAGPNEPSYTLSVPIRPGTPSPIEVGSDTEVDSSDPDGTDALVTQGAFNDTYDFGFYDVVLVYDVSGTVYVDADDDGEFSVDDVPVGGVTVFLYYDLNGDGILDDGDAFLFSAITAPDGAYAFSGLPNGNYLIKLETPEGATNVNDVQGAPDDGLIALVIAGDDVGEQNFLIAGVDLYTISGTVRSDIDNDGMLDGDEPGVPDVVLELRDENGVLIAATITNMDGEYTFPNLLPGDYRLNILNPVGAINVTDADGNANGPNLIEVTVDDQNVEDQDFLIFFYQIVAKNDLSEDNMPGSAVGVDVLFNDVEGPLPLDPATVQIVGTANPGDSFEVSGEGTWSVNTIIGVITFTPESGFVADPTPIQYTVADTAGIVSNAATVIVTYTFLCIQIEVHVYLEGAAIDPGGAVSYTLPMRTDLNELRILPGQAYEDPFSGAVMYQAPGQPYSDAPWFYAGNEGDFYDSYGEPLYGDAGYPATVVDWVLVSLRDTPDGQGGPLCQAAALLHDTGKIELVDQVFTCCELDLNAAYYLVIEHRNHLIIMSESPLSIVNGQIVYDFRDKQSYLDDPFGFGVHVAQKEILGGVYAMYGANGDQASDDAEDTDITENDRNFWESENGLFGQYLFGDYNLDGDTEFNDRILWEINNGKFTSVPRD